jgi:LmbE family N-acetylglucosaminyl deacetylase
MGKTVLALVAHPDDIEFMMAGTLFRLRDRGYEVHYMTVANGSCGTTEYGYDEIVRMRRSEALAAAAYMGAVYHESIVNDFEVFYQDELIRKVVAVIRKVKPDMVLLPSMEDYMEDHMNSARIGVTAAFAKGSPNYISIPPQAAIQMDVVLYHAMPAGLRDMMGNPIIPALFVDISGVMDRKTAMLGMHKSQQAWLDASQGMNEYLQTMQGTSRQVGALSGKFEFAEGWRLHNHLGYSRTRLDPLGDLFGR